MNPAPDVIVAVPARDEAELIGQCLRALACQQGGHCVYLTVLLNNCTDDTPAAVRYWRNRLGLPGDVIACNAAPAEIGAGFGRRAAMDHAAALAAGWQDKPILMTTDADGRVYPDWIEANLSAIAKGAEAVAGRVILDPHDAGQIPQQLHDADARDMMYRDMLDRITSLLDPDPFDPWPRHTEHSGASIAVTPAAYRRAGGMPRDKTGEDRAFFTALRSVDARIRHAPEVKVVVSGRLCGRAVGGMADTIVRRILSPDTILDEQLKTAAAASLRAIRRAELRRIWHGKPRSGRQRIRPDEYRHLLGMPYFGQAWATFEQSRPELVRRRLAAVDLEREIQAAQHIIHWLERHRAATRPADSAAETIAAPE